MEITQKLVNATDEIVKINRENTEKKQKIDMLESTLGSEKREMSKIHKKNESIVEDN